MQLIFVGGGHSHALFLSLYSKALSKWTLSKKLRAHLERLEITVISPQTHSPYSGMLPGLIAGHYDFTDCHIDLTSLCQSCNATFITAQVNSIDTTHKLVHLDNQTTLSFDLLSINTGITPDLSITGAAEFSIPVKPIADFYPKWQKLLAQLQNDQTQNLHHMCVVGGGAAGCELILAMHEKLTALNLSAAVQLHLVHKGSSLLQGYPHRAAKKMQALMQARGIQVHLNNSVAEVQQKNIAFSDNNKLNCDSVFWCTGAQANNWLQQSNLPLSSSGFIAVRPTLQSTENDCIFAVGDTAEFTAQPLAKAGVYAVRQAPVLFQNICRLIQNQPLKDYRPQKTSLSLLSCGNKYAIAAQLGTDLPSIAGHWVWHWKNKIDKKFMDQF